MARGAVVAIILAIVISAGFADRSAASHHFPEDPPRGGTLVVAVNGDPEHLNGALSTTAAVQQVTQSLYDSLVLDLSSGDVVPNLAESWEVSEDATRYTFHLVQNALWHDGEPFTSDDVKFTAEEVWKVFHSRNSQALQNLETVETPDPYTAIFVFSEPYSALLPSLGKYDGNIIPRHIYGDGQPIDEHPRNIENPIGTGPFMLAEHRPGESITMVRNPNYWRGNGQPYLDQVVFRILPDPTSRALAIEAGDVDFIPTFSNVPIPEVRRLGDLDGISIGVHGEESRLPAGMGLMFNLRNEITGDLEVRRAIAHAIDLQFMTDTVMEGFAIPMNGPFSGSAWYDDNAVTKYPFDIELANQILDDAGYPRGADGIRFELTHVNDSSRGESTRATDIIVASLSEIGIAVRVDSVDTPTLSDRLFLNPDFDMGIAGAFNGLGPDPVVGIRAFHHSENIRPAPFVNGAAWSNPVFDEAIDAAASVIDPAERQRHFSTAAAEVTKDLPYLWMMAPNRVTLYRDEFANFTTFDWLGVDLGAVHMSQPTAAISGSPEPAGGQSPGATPTPSASESEGDELPVVPVLVALAGGAVLITAIGVFRRRRSEE